jgi:hypothetical protein
MAIGDSAIGIRKIKKSFSRFLDIKKIVLLKTFNYAVFFTSKTERFIYTMCFNIKMYCRYQKSKIFGTLKTLFPR